MNILSSLEQLGYPAGQVKIYLASLQMGEATIAEIAEEVNIARTTVSDLVTEMHKHGLMNYYTKRGRKYWVAEDPDKLMMILHAREASLKSILPQLHAMKFDGGDQKPGIKLFIGHEEVKVMLDDMIDTGHHIMSVVSWDDFEEFFGNEFVDDLIERRNARRLQMRLITTRTKLSTELKKQDAKQLRHTRFLPENIELRRTSTFIYGDTVTLISLNRKQPTGILIHDQDVVHGQTLYFESLWAHSSDR